MNLVFRSRLVLTLSIVAMFIASAILSAVIIPLTPETLAMSAAISLLTFVAFLLTVTIAILCNIFEAQCETLKFMIQNK